MAVEGLLEKNLPPDILDDRSQKKVRRCDLGIATSSLGDLGIATSSLGDLGIAHDNPSSKDVLMASDGEAFFSDDNMESNNKGFFEKESIDGSEGKNVDLEMENFDEFRVQIVDGVVERDNVESKVVELNDIFDYEKVKGSNNVNDSVVYNSENASKSNFREEIENYSKKPMHVM
ncbi:hypothetical protein POUND7_009817 [Theobroma cacao]